MLWFVKKKASVFLNFYKFSLNFSSYCLVIFPMLTFSESWYFLKEGILKRDNLIIVFTLELIAN